MSNLKNDLHAAMQDKPEGHLFSPKDFQYLGDRRAVSRAFLSLVKEQLLVRISKGLYAITILTRFGIHSPSVESIIASLMFKTGEVIARHGAWEANLLGLSRQVPLRCVYLTSGRTRDIKLLGQAEINLVHAPDWKLIGHDRRLGAVIRTLDWLGETHAEKALSKLTGTLTKSEWNELGLISLQLPTPLIIAIWEYTFKEMPHNYSE